MKQKKLHKFKKYLEYKCNKKRVNFLLINETYTTQICNNYGKKKKPNIKEFKRSNCGLEMHENLNGSINNKKQGLNKLK